MVFINTVSALSVIMTENGLVLPCHVGHYDQRIGLMLYAMYHAVVHAYNVTAHNVYQQDRVWLNAHKNFLIFVYIYIFHLVWVFL